MNERFRIPYVDNWAELMAPVVADVVADRVGVIRDQQPFMEWVAGDRSRYEHEVDVWLEKALAAF